MRPFGTSGSVQVRWTEVAVTLSTTGAVRLTGKSVDVVSLVEGPCVQPARVHASAYTSYVVYARRCRNSISGDAELVACNRPQA